METEKLPLEAALDKVGFGLYSYLLMTLAGFMTISSSCIAFSNMFIVPTSACELDTTPAQQGMLAVGPVVGLLTGSVWGYLTDTRGRRAMLLVAFTGASVVNLIATISVNWIMLLILQFFAAAFLSGAYSMTMTLISESVPIAKRDVVILIVSSIYIFAQGAMALLAIPISRLTFSIYVPTLGIYWNSWRTLLAVYSIPCLISALCLYFMQESPKYAFAKGDEGRALEILRKIHKLNNRGYKEELLVKGLLKDEITVTTGPPSAKDQIVPLFRAPLLKSTIIMTILFATQQIGAFLIWLPTIADRFMRALHAGGSTNMTMCGVLDMEAPPDDPDTTPCALDETSLIFVIGIGVLQSITNLIISSLVNTVGCRNISLIVLAVCGVSGILVNLVPNVIASAVFFTILLLGFLLFGLYAAIGVALFPTNLRTMALTLTMTLGQDIGSIVSVQILNLMLVNNCDAGFYLFSSILLASIIVAALLPDDRKVQDLISVPLQIENPVDKSATRLINNKKE